MNYHDEHDEMEENCPEVWEALDGYVHTLGDDRDEPYSSVEGHPDTQQRGLRGGGCLIFFVAGPVISVLLALTFF